MKIPLSLYPKLNVVDLFDVEFELTTIISEFDNSEIPEEYTIKIKYENKVIGLAKIYKISTLGANDLFYMCDGFSSNLTDIFLNITKSGRNGNFQYIKPLAVFDDYSTFIFIDEIGIEAEYRGNGILENLLVALDNFFGNDCIQLLLASPLSYSNKVFNRLETFGTKEFELIRKKIINSYKKSNFIQIKQGSPYMYKINLVDN